MDEMTQLPVDLPVQQEVQQPVFTQEQVNRMIGREKANAAERARREAEEKHQRELEALNAQRMQQQQRNAEVPRDVDTDAIYQQLQERFNKDLQERQMKDQMTQVANNYLSRVAQGKNDYQDFDEVTKDFDPTAFPQLTFLLSGLDNASDILYELSKSPEKLALLDNLAVKSPRLAHSGLLKLSQSINTNKQAKADAQNQNVSEPLDRLQTSRVSGSNGKMSIRDLRNQPWLRG